MAGRPRPGSINRHEGVFAGAAVNKPHAREPGRLMGELARRAVRAFRIHPKQGKQPAERWLRPAGYGKMFAAGPATTRP
jgi:hypothetical protein